MGHRTRPLVPCSGKSHLGIYPNAKKIGGAAIPVVSRVNDMLKSKEERGLLCQRKAVIRPLQNPLCRVTETSVAQKKVLPAAAR
jgi:hypothetical protein